MQNTAEEVGTNSCGPLHVDEQRQDDQLEPTFHSSVPIRNVALMTCRKQWTMGKGRKRRLGMSVLIAWQDDADDDNDVCVCAVTPAYIYIYMCVCVCLRILGRVFTRIHIFPLSVDGEGWDEEREWEGKSGLGRVGKWIVVIRMISFSFKLYDICRCLPPNRTWHKVNDSKVGLKLGLEEGKVGGTSWGSNSAGLCWSLPHLKNI